MTKLQIYKASAGAGKTFRLTVEYIKIALQNQWAYKNILAVTFTNKATAEMKERVLHELYNLSKGKKTPYLEVIKNETKLSEGEIEHKSAITLKQLLHDYSRFSISTIDSFFQRVIKSFNRELGINSSYQVELDKERYLNEAVDRVLLATESNKRLYNWLNRYANENIKNGNDWDVKKGMQHLAKELHAEDLNKDGDELFKRLSNPELLDSYQAFLEQIITNYENALINIGKEGMKLLSENKLSPSDFKYRNTSAVTSFKKMIDLSLTTEGKRFLDAVDNYETILPAKPSEQILSIAPRLSELMRDALGHIEKHICKYSSAKLIYKDIYSLGILADIRMHLNETTHEKNVSLLSDSSKLLQQIIDKSDTPFIYERTGIYFKNFMIDEFQDTSGMQWDNFRPLLDNSLSEGNQAMLVGDVKQAIYGWRGGDWSLLTNQVYEDFKDKGTKDQLLNENWRSSGNVIRFNNRVFQVLPSILQNNFNSTSLNLPDNISNTLPSIYKDGLQHIGNKSIENEGYVNIRFINKKEANIKDDEAKSIALDYLIDSIKDAQDRGVDARQMTVLVRKKKEAQMVANRLLSEKEKSNNKYNFNVLSNESLLIKSAPSVSFLITLFRLLKNNEDKLSTSYAIYQFYAILKPRLKQLNLEVIWSLNNDNDHSESENTKLNSIEPQDIFENINNENLLLFKFIKSPEFKQDLATRSLQEIIFKLARRFCLFSLSEDLPYLQSFIDWVSKHQRNRISDLNSFLEWWDDKGQDKTVNVSESLNAIRILTVHKAKGLEYDCVFIPFSDWDTYRKTGAAPTIWCSTENTEFSAIPLVPIQASEKKIFNSVFAQQYYKHKLNKIIEELNALYVAFTRAKFELHICSSYATDADEIGHSLHQLICNDSNYPFNEQENITIPLQALYDEESNCFSYGEKKTYQPNCTPQTNSNLNLSHLTFEDFDSYLQLRKNHENFFEQTNNVKQSVNHGKIIHELLSNIKQKDELDQAFKKLNMRGLIDTNKIDEIKEQVFKMLSDPEVCSWFDGSYTVLNERSILLGTAGIKRPDRIMTKGDTAIVVDYKSGELEDKKHHKQVSNYIANLKKCGYSSVSGYIWYTRNNKRIKVT